MSDTIVLRPLKNTDDEQLFALRSDKEIARYINRPLAGNIDDARKFISAISEAVAKNDAAYWAIALPENDQLIGAICLFSFSNDKQQCEIGYELAPAYQGRGIMKEAIQKAINFAFATFNLKEIKAAVHRENHRSIRLLEKLKFGETNSVENPEPHMRYFHLENPANH